MDRVLKDLEKGFIVWVEPIEHRGRSQKHFEMDRLQICNHVFFFGTSELAAREHWLLRRYLDLQDVKAISSLSVSLVVVGEATDSNGGYLG